MNDVTWLRADVILAVGTRLQDFTTGSWTAFSAEAQFIVDQRALSRREHGLPLALDALRS